MSHKNKSSLVKQTTDALTAKLRAGQSKFEAKKDGSFFEGIYSYSTLHAYLQHCVAFVKYCKERHKCKSLADCRQYADQYLMSRSGLSAYTLKLDVAALAKLFSCSSADFIKTRPRLRSEITRSRKNVTRDKHFSETNNATLVTFCRATGLRRHELKALCGSDWKEEDGVLFVHVRSGKGGKERYARVIGDVDTVKTTMLCAGAGKVFPRISSAADIHGYRREYATAYYNAIARPIDTIKPSERYLCRKDKKGIVYDRRAMLTVSRSLGHNRIDVIAGHYIDKVDRK